MKTIVNDIYGNPVGEMDVPVVERSIVEEWEMMRGKRNFLLAQTDIYGLSDRTMTQAQKDYRQALRDITKNATSLDDVSWPTKP